MASMERLSSIVQVRRRSVLADVASRRRGDGDTRVSGYFSDIGSDVIGRIKDSDYEAFDSRVRQLNTKINEFCLVPTDDEDVVGWTKIREECLSSRLASEWNAFRREWDDREGLKPTIDDYNNKWVPGMDRFVIRYKTVAGKSEAEKALSELPSGFGEPLPPVMPGEADAKPKRPGLSPRPPSSPSTSPFSSIAGAIARVPTPLLVLVVATVAAVGGYFLLTKLTKVVP